MATALRHGLSIDTRSREDTELGRAWKTLRSFLMDESCPATARLSPPRQRWSVKWPLAIDYAILSCSRAINAPSQ